MRNLKLPTFGIRDLLWLIVLVAVLCWSEAAQKKTKQLYERKWETRVLDRHEAQGERPTEDVEVHALRIGDAALVTNPFELFLDFGLRMKARSRAQQTFIAQLACGALGNPPLLVAGGDEREVLLP